MDWWITVIIFALLIVKGSWYLLLLWICARISSDDSVGGCSRIWCLVSSVKLWRYVLLFNCLQCKSVRGRLVGNVATGFFCKLDHWRVIVLKSFVGLSRRQLLSVHIASRFCILGCGAYLAFTKNFFLTIWNKKLSRLCLCASRYNYCRQWIWSTLQSLRSCWTKLRSACYMFSFNQSKLLCFGTCFPRPLYLRLST